MSVQQSLRVRLGMVHMQPCLALHYRLRSGKGFSGKGMCSGSEEFVAKFLVGFWLAVAIRGYCSPVSLHSPS